MLLAQVTITILLGETTMLSSRNVRFLTTTMVMTIVVTVFSARIASAVEWLRFSNGARGNDPIWSNFVINDNYYICAGRTPNGYQAGHLGENQSVCYVAWGQGHLAFSSYFVLQGSQEVAWVDRNIADPRQVITLDPEDGIPTLICKSRNGLPGKVVHGGLRNGICYTSWNDYNIRHTNFDVLVKVKR
ncbi:MAG: hypothetical protein B0A82_08295 [Alkalinema sp. CACIAM 70d]|nr:MAG: hypothetical protein B0A82_08295 [Alkalinema sp. CACIAM 70d]